MSSSSLGGAVDYAALGSGSYGANGANGKREARSHTRLAARDEPLRDPPDNLKTDEVPFAGSDTPPMSPSTVAEATRDIEAALTRNAAAMGLLQRDPEQTITRQGELAPITRSSSAGLAPPTLVRGPLTPLLDRDDPENLNETLARPFPIAPNDRPAFVYPLADENEVATRESPVRADLADAQEARLAAPPPSAPLSPAPSASAAPASSAPPTLGAASRPSLSSAPETLVAPPAPTTPVPSALSSPPPPGALFAQTQLLPQSVLPKRPSVFVVPEVPTALAATALAPTPAPGVRAPAGQGVVIPLVMITTPEDNRTRIAPLPPMPMPMPMPMATPLPQPAYAPAGSRAATPTVQVVSRTAPLPVGKIALVALATFLLAASIPFFLRRPVSPAVAVPAAPAAEQVTATAVTTPPAAAPAVVVTGVPGPPPTMTPGARAEGPRPEAPRKHLRHSSRAPGPTRRDP